MAASAIRTKTPKYSIVVPCFNEQDNIVPLVQEIIAVLNGDSNFELIVVDDCSTDLSAQRLVDLSDNLDIRLRILVHNENAGQSAAVYTGAQVAHGEWVATLDGDGQNDPADILRLIAELESIQSVQQTGEVAPIICGYRKQRQDSWSKRYASKFANAIRARLLRDGTPDTGCGLKLIHRESFLRLPRFDHMHRFLPALMQRQGAQVVSVEVNHRPRSTGLSKYGVHNRLWVGIVDLIGVIWLRRRNFKLMNYKEY
jgi:dolichol-phosphate mannosyltransferase